MKSFSQKTKEGLCRLDVGKKCCLMAEFSGILMFAGKLKQKEIRVSSETLGIVERFKMLAEKCFDNKAEIKMGKNNYFYIITDEKILEKIYINIECKKDGAYEYKYLRKVLEQECCRSAFLRGAFLGGGTVIDPNKNYNIEFTVRDKTAADEFEKLIKAMSLDFKRTERKSLKVLYAKNSDVICDTLTYMGAFGAQMEILNVKIERELRNDLNRVANGETANMDKVITAAIRQIRAIEKIEERLGLDNISEELREVALIRKENKDLSLEELGQMLSPKLSKSGVNHRLKKIIDIAEGLK